MNNNDKKKKIEEEKDEEEIKDTTEEWYDEDIDWDEQYDDRSPQEKIMDGMKE